MDGAGSHCRFCDSIRLMITKTNIRNTRSMIIMDMITRSMITMDMNIRNTRSMIITETSASIIK